MSEPSDKREEAAPRKPFQYSLRSLFVVTTLLAAALGLIKWQPLIAASAFFFFYFLFLVYLVRCIFRKGLGLADRLLLIFALAFLSPPLMLLWFVLLGTAFHFLDF